MKTIVLAAGQGTRLGELTRNQPKALVQVVGTPLIDYSLKFLAQQSSNQVVVVGGYAFPALQKHLTQYPNVVLLENRNFHLGSVVTLWTAKDLLVDEDILIMNADHIYSNRFLTRFLQAPGDVVAACDFDRTLGLDDMKIAEQPKGFVRAISKQLSDYQGGYIGMTLIRREGLLNYRAALQALWEEDKQVAVERVLQKLIDQGYPPRIADLSGDRWYEIDTPEDLARAEQALNKQALAV